MMLRLSALLAALLLTVGLASPAEATLVGLVDDPGATEVFFGESTTQAQSFTVVSDTKITAALPEDGLQHAG